MYSKCTMKKYSHILSQCEIVIEIVFDDNVDNSTINPHYYKIHEEPQFVNYNSILDLIKAFHRDYTEYVENEFMKSHIIVCGVV